VLDDAAIWEKALRLAIVVYQFDGSGRFGYTSVTHIRKLVRAMGAVSAIAEGGAPVPPPNGRSFTVSRSTGLPLDIFWILKSFKCPTDGWKVERLE
jgi:hypothetical protein